LPGNGHGNGTGPRTGRPPRILILVENLSVPFDRRVWQESRALVGAGCEVHVICPQGRKLDTETYAEIEGVHIHRYPLTAATGGAVGYLREYGQAMWHTLRLAARLGWRKPIDVVHACNPPDLFWLVGLLCKLRGARFVYDQHDLVPELTLSRFGEERRGLYRLCRLLERLTFATADLVISTNGSYRDVAVSRGRKSPEDVHVVRSAPDIARFNGAQSDPGRKRGAPHLLCYLGVMGPQDGLDYALRALAALRGELGRSDWRAVFVGAGDTLEESKVLAQQLGLDDVVEFTGRVSDDELRTWLSTADVCLAPDPKNPLNDVSTMNKIMEYMALGKPIVSFDLVEARVSAGPAAAYAPANDESAFARAIAELLDDPDRRAEMGRVGEARVAGDLSWDVSRANLLAAYRSVLEPAGRRFGSIRSTRPALTATRDLGMPATRSLSISDSGNR
jgi:glycosyltransferase involved in cell wall biosynthesis